MIVPDDFKVLSLMDLDGMSTVSPSQAQQALLKVLHELP